MSIRTIPVTAGGVEYVTGDFADPDNDISSDTLQLALLPHGGDLADVDWVDAVNTDAAAHLVSGQILIDADVEPGTYRVCGRLADSPEVVIRADSWVTVT